MAADPGTGDPGTGEAPAAAEPVLSLGYDDRVVLCCAGSGIRAATFGLGVLQALQQAPLWTRVRTIVAVSGGAYIAAARTLAARDRTRDGGSAPARPVRAAQPGGTPPPQPHPLPAGKLAGDGARAGHADPRGHG